MEMGKKSRNVIVLLATMASATALVAGVGSHLITRADASSLDGGTATFISAPASSFVDNFNPFSPSNPAITNGLASIYEPLLYYNEYTGAFTPKLATSYTFSANHLTLTFHLREGVKWSDGTPFTSADVVFSLNLLLKHPDVDSNGLGNLVKSVSAKGKYEVVVNLKTVNNSALLYIGSSTYILPQHVWKSASDPAAFVDKNPVTTGPFVLGTFSQSLIVLKKNPTYWDKGEPHIDKIDFPLYLDNNSAAFAMAQGNFDVGIQFIPNMKTTFLNRDPSNYHYWFPPIGDRILMLNLTRYPLNNVEFRQALTMSIDRNKMTQLGEYGYEKPLDSTAVPPAAADKQFEDTAIANTYSDNFNIPKAKSILKKAGFTWDSSGNLIDPKGKKVSLTILVSQGATNQVADAQVISEGFQQLGINVNVQTPTGSTLYSEMANGSFDIAMKAVVQPTLYMDFNTVLNSAFTAPIGKPATSNDERWNDKTTDSLLNQYSQTFDPKQQQATMFKLEKIVAQQVPFIPLCNYPSWEEFNTSRFTGWPSASNPYAAFYASPFDSMYVLATIHKK